MKKKTCRNKQPRPKKPEPVLFRLEYWDGQDWSEAGFDLIGEPEWKKLKPQIKRWSCPWRLIGEVIIEQSRKKPV